MVVRIWQLHQPSRPLQRLGPVIPHICGHGFGTQIIKVFCPKVCQHGLPDLVAIVLSCSVGKTMMPKDNISRLPVALYRLNLFDHFFKFHQVGIAMGNAFEFRQVGVIGNTRLVVAQGKGRK